MGVSPYTGDESSGRDGCHEPPSKPTDRSPPRSRSQGADTRPGKETRWSFAFTGVEFGSGNYEESADWARKTVEVTPDFPAPWRYLAASLAHLGRIKEAEAAKDQLMRVMPHESLALVRAALPSVDPDRMARFEDGLRKAGVPE